MGEQVVSKERITNHGEVYTRKPEVNAMLDTTIREIKSQEFTAPDVYEKFAVLFPDEMDKLKERYKNIPHFSSKTYIARGLDSYSRRESAPFIATDKLAQAHSEWGFPQVKVYKKKI